MDGRSDVEVLLRAYERRNEASGNWNRTSFSSA